MRARRWVPSMETSAATAPTRASAPLSTRRPGRLQNHARRPEMISDRIAEDTVRGAAGPSGGTLSRRTFLMAGAAVGGGLLIGVGFGAAATAPAKAAGVVGSAAFSPNAFVRIDPDGQVTVTIRFAEMVQGTYTPVPMLSREVLEVDLTSRGSAVACPDET